MHLQTFTTLNTLKFHRKIQYPTAFLYLGAELFVTWSNGRRSVTNTNLSFWLTSFSCFGGRNFSPTKKSANQIQKHHFAWKQMVLSSTFLGSCRLNCPVKISNRSQIKVYFFWSFAGNYKFFVRLSFCNFLGEILKLLFLRFVMSEKIVPKTSIGCLSVVLTLSTTVHDIERFFSDWRTCLESVLFFIFRV